MLLREIEAMDQKLLTEQAHTYALSQGFDSSEDQFYEYEGNLFCLITRGEKPKSKLICNVIPRLVNSYNSASEDKPAYKYVFSIYHWRTDTTIEKTFSPKQLSSRRLSLLGRNKAAPLSLALSPNSYEGLFSKNVQKLDEYAV